MLTEAEALALVEGAIRQHAASAESEFAAEYMSLGDMLSREPPMPTSVTLFARSTEHWLRSARHLQHLNVSYSWAWSYVAKPWLTTLVGWDAASELGRLAGYGGYSALAQAWNAEWDDVNAETASP